jgi:hypothetical protein
MSFGILKDAFIGNPSDVANGPIKAAVQTTTASGPDSHDDRHSLLQPTVEQRGFISISA